jgi:hypothetical protein
LKWEPAQHSLISLRELNMTNGSKIQVVHLERPFIVTDKNGEPLALFAATSIDEPSAAVTNVKDSQNTFSVYIPLLKSKR